MTLSTPLAKRHRAMTVVYGYPQFRQIAVNVDTCLPTAALPASVVGNRIGHGAAAITPTRTDPTPGSGAAPLQAKATSALGAGFALAAVGGSSSPTSLLTYSGPASNDAVALSFSQDVGASEALRTGSYSKALTFTLSTTTP